MTPTQASFSGILHLQSTLPRTPGKTPGESGRAFGTLCPRTGLHPTRRRGVGLRGGCEAGMANRALTGWTALVVVARFVLLASSEAGGGASAGGGGGSEVARCHWLKIPRAEGGAKGQRPAESPGRPGPPQGLRLEAPPRGAGQGRERRDLGPEPSCTVWRRAAEGGEEEGIRFLSCEMSRAGIKGGYWVQKHPVRRTGRTRAALIRDKQAGPARHPSPTHTLINL